MNQAGTPQTPKMNNCFWKFRNLAEGQKAELLLYGAISESSWWGDEVTPKKFAEDLNALGNVQEIEVYINSGGGDVFAAQTIGNMLERNSATVIAHIDGLCASAATIVACHADRVIAAADATYMVHPPSMGTGKSYLTAEDMRNCLKALDTIRGNIVTLYAKKTGKSEDECGTWMDETNWWTAAQAKENGFVDEVDDEESDAVVENRNGVLFVNSIGMGLPFDKAPDFVKSRMGAKTPGGFSNATNNPGKTGTQEEETMAIENKNDLVKTYPDMVNEIKKDAAVDAINRERARIKDIQDMTMPGMEKIMQDALYGENHMDATQYAKEVAKFARKQAEDKTKGLHDDAQSGGANSVNSVDPGDQQTDIYLDALRAVSKKQ